VDSKSTYGNISWTSPGSIERTATRVPSFWQGEFPPAPSGTTTSASMLPVSTPRVRTVVRPQLFRSDQQTDDFQTSKFESPPRALLPTVSMSYEGVPYEALPYHLLPHEARPYDSLSGDSSQYSPFDKKPGTSDEFFFLSAETRYARSPDAETRAPCNVRVEDGRTQSITTSGLQRGKRRCDADEENPEQDKKRPRKQTGGAETDSTPGTGQIKNTILPAARQPGPDSAATQPVATPEPPRRSPRLAIQISGNSSTAGRMLSGPEIEHGMAKAVMNEDAAALTTLIDVYRPKLDKFLSQAARLGKTKSVQVLLDRGANIQAADHDGETPLMCAVSKGYCDVVTAMLAHAPGELNLKTRGGTTLLHLAVHGASEAMVTELLKRGANPNACEYRGYNALHIAMLVNSASTNSIAGHLLKYGVNTTALTARGETFLHLAASSRMAALPQALEAASRKVVDIPDSVGRTPLMWACLMGNGTAVRQLLRLGARRDVEGPRGKTARDIAVESGYADIVGILDGPEGGPALNLSSKTTAPATSPSGATSPSTSTSMSTDRGSFGGM
jgi:ankyrin repeat protein